jgi:hypothetical protein
MRANRPVATSAEGTVYVVSVSGDKFADQAARDYAEVAIPRTSTYQTIEIDPARDLLTYRAWDDSGEVVDRLEIPGHGHAGERSPSRPPGLARGEPSRIR